MRTIGNLLWLILGGIWLALGYLLGGLVMCVTIIGIPFGIQAFKMAGLVLWPFGRTVVARPDAGGVAEVIFNVIWLVLVLCLTIIGIPFGIQSFKLSVLALWPFGREIVEVP